MRIIALGTVALLSILMALPANAGQDFNLSVPSGWQDRTGNLQGSLVRQLVEPREYAFVEVHAFPPEGSLKSQADSVEAMVRGNWPGVFSNRTSSQFRAINGADGIENWYRGRAFNQPVQAILINARSASRHYAIFGIWVDTDNYGPTTQQAVQSFTLAGAGASSSSLDVRGSWMAAGCTTPITIEQNGASVTRLYRDGKCNASDIHQHWESRDLHWSGENTLEFEWYYVEPAEYAGSMGKGKVVFHDQTRSTLHIFDQGGAPLGTTDYRKTAMAPSPAPKTAPSPAQPAATPPQARQDSGEGQGAKEAGRYLWVHDAITGVWIKIPDGWEPFAMGGGMFGRQLQAAKNSNTTYINLWIEEGYSMTAAELAEHYESQTLGQPGNASGRLADSWQLPNTKLKGADVLCRDYSGSKTGVNTRTKSCYLTRGSTLYFLQATWPEGDGDAEYQLRQSMLSMRLDRPKQAWIDKSAGLKEFTK